MPKAPLQKQIKVCIVEFPTSYISGMYDNLRFVSFGKPWREVM